jgi:DNA (cytosine-5)-methyltransferase 1
MIKLATAFSGIGAIEQALLKNNINHKLVFASDNGNVNLKVSQEEIDSAIENFSPKEKKKYIDQLYKETQKENFVEKSYFANYEISKEHYYQDVRFLMESV